MKNLKVILTIGAISLSLASCKKEKDGIQLAGSDYLVFGHYYGMCQGEECVEIFRLESNRLLEDHHDTYPPQANGFYVGDYTALSQGMYNDIKDLANYFPNELLDITERSIGNPEIADGGGLYIEYNYNGTHQYWLIDQTQNGVPQSLHPFMDKVNEKIGIINQ